MLLHTLLAAQAVLLHTRVYVYISNGVIPVCRGHDYHRVTVTVTVTVTATTTEQQKTLRRGEGTIAAVAHDMSANII